MFFDLHAYQSGHVTGDEYHALRPTVISRRQLLLGSTSDGTIAVRRDYENTNPLEGSFSRLHAKDLNVVGRTDFHSYWDTKTDPWVSALHFRPRDLVPFTLLDNTEQTVVAWHFIGIDFTDESEFSDDPLIGQFALGLPLDEAELLASGRMWLKWSCDPMRVTPTTAVHFGFADESGEFYANATAATVEVRDRANSWLKTKRTYAPTYRDSPNMVIPVDRLFSEQTAITSMEVKADFTSNFGKELADSLMTELYGDDIPAEVEPYAEKPAATGTLWSSTDIAREFDSPMDGTVIKASMLSYQEKAGSSLLQATRVAHSKTSKTFTFPSDTSKGVKLSVRVRDRNFSNSKIPAYNFSLKCCRDDQPDVVEHERQSIFMMSNYYPAPNAGFVGGYNPQQSTYIYHTTHEYLGFSADNLEGFRVRGFDHELYEAYIMGDGRTYLYIDGKFVGRYLTTSDAIERGAEYTFSLLGYYMSAEFTELKVEAFDIPLDYVAPIEKPDVYAFAAWSGYSSYGNVANMRPYMFDGKLSYHNKQAYIHLYNRSNYYVDFSVTAPMQLRAFSDHSTTEFYLINLGTGEESVVTIARDRWGSISDNLAAGRWRLKGKAGYTILTQFEINPPVLPPEPEPVA